MTHPGVCIHGGLRRSCEPCDLADRLDKALAVVAEVRGWLGFAERELIEVLSLTNVRVMQRKLDEVE